MQIPFDVSSGDQLDVENYEMEIEWLLSEVSLTFWILKFRELSWTIFLTILIYSANPQHNCKHILVVQTALLKPILKQSS